MPTRATPKYRSAISFTACLILLACALSAASAQAPNPVVQTASGKVSGVAGAASSAFKGIPYAAPPVGDLRWRPPVPPAAWHGIRAADHFSASCMQSVRGEFLPWTHEFMVENQVSEDCLYLNIWTPRVSAKAALPVIVFIHGGAFREGSGGIAVYDGANLAATGVVVVTINYRLGVFGFFAYPGLTAESPHHSSGNYALMDQMAALRWVQSNIAGFGGDPHRVTIWGQSAGAFSVDALLASPVARGLFQRAAADSGIGVATLPMSTLAQAEDTGTRFGLAHDAHTLQQLRALPAAALLPKESDPPLQFAPNIDGWILPRAPHDLDSHGEGSDVPVMTGYQANDGLLFVAPNLSPAGYKQFAGHLYGSMSDEFMRLYPAASDEAARSAMMESTRDRDRVSMFLWAVQWSSSHRSPVYTYFFDRGIPWPQHPQFGAFHSGELPYFFRNLKALDRPWEPVDFHVSHLASSYLKNFAAQGDPAGAGLPVWPAVQEAAPQTMQIGSHTGSMPLADKAKYDFWTRYFRSPEALHAPVF